MPRPCRDQKAFFEQDPPRLATRVFANPRFLRSMRKKAAFIARQLDGCRRVLEVGTGRGLHLDVLLPALAEGADYVGIDVAYGPLASARPTVAHWETGRATLINADVQALPFASAVFDGVFCLDVLHHVESQEAMLTEVSRVLRPGGTLVCVEPNPTHPLNVIYRRDPIERKLFELNAANVSRWTSAAGFVDVRITHLPIFLPSVPNVLAGAYERAEHVLDTLSWARGLATARVVLGRRR